MKKIETILALSIIILFCSCEDIFDREPLNKIPETEVWQNEAMIDAYVTDMYYRFPWTGTVNEQSSSNPVRYTNPFSHYQWFTWTDESTQAAGNTTSTGIPRGNTSRSSDEPAFWDYRYIRDLNTFLEKIGTTTLADTRKAQLEGEVRTIRAIVYFEMQKRYGGVPLVDIVIDPYGEIDQKYTKRSKEETIADFIDSELTKAVGLLSENVVSYGRINKWVALAYKARANLFAASIAKYGSVQLDGLTGIPASRANDFYTKASEAAQAVIASGKYSLYNKDANKSENYRKLFLDENNGETIFGKIYDGVNVGHSWDLYNAPPTLSSGRGGGANPTLEFILGYENTDGSATQPEFGQAHLYDSGYAPFANKDPRLLATVFFQGDNWIGKTINTYEGIDPSATPDPTRIISSNTQLYNGMPSAGADSRIAGSDDITTNSGFIVKKYIREEGFIGVGLSKTNWIAIRLAEMYLTRAEAEFEMGHPDIAATALNATRERAGISMVDAGTITLNKVRTERRSELSFEDGIRYWDLRRWRIASDVLNARRFQGLRIIYHYASGKYYFLPINCESFSRVFNPEHYYNPITNGRISNNPDLVENPLY
jgi:hypothetical protein